MKSFHKTCYWSLLYIKNSVHIINAHIDAFPQAKHQYLTSTQIKKQNVIGVMKTFTISSNLQSLLFQE